LAFLHGIIPMSFPLKPQWPDPNFLKRYGLCPTFRLDDEAHERLILHP
jgi:hypothetical protein